MSPLDPTAQDAAPPPVRRPPRQRVRARLPGAWDWRNTRTVIGGGDCKLAVHEAGPETAPAILFVHGFSQSGLCWIEQMRGILAHRFRLVAFDLRGHGQSDHPEPENAYTYDRLWAEDVAAVMDACRLRRPVLAGWSYGGLVIADYLRHFGFDRVAGLHLIGAISRIGGPAKATVGPDFLQLLNDLNQNDLDAFATAGARLLDLCSHRPLSQSRASVLAGQMARVPSHVRRALFARRLDNDDLLRRINLPVLITHGSADRIVLAVEAQRHAAIIPNSRLVLFRDVGHAPFLEAPARFNRALAGFAAACHSGQ